MSRSRSSIGFFGTFGRSADLRQLDDALRAVDVHPRLVPDAVKITAVNLLKQGAGTDTPAVGAYRAAAEIIGYCVIGAAGFAAANDVRMCHEVVRRIEDALEVGDSLDAQLILLTLHAGVIQPSVVESHGLESADGGMDERAKPSDEAC